MAVNSLTVYSSSQLVDTFSLSESGIDYDAFQILNIEGLDPVKATVNTTSLASVDGESLTGETVPTRNIVLTIRTNPDWNTNFQEGLRKQLFDYFTPKNTVRLVFSTDEFDDVEIYGVVEGVDANPFTQEPQFVISIICPDPYFVKVTPTVITGSVVSPESWPTEDIGIDGQVPVGFKLKTISPSEDPGFHILGTLIVQVGDPSISTFRLDDQTDASPDFMMFVMDSRPLHKYIRLVNLTSGIFKNVLNGLEETSVWPLLQPGSNHFAVMAEGSGAIVGFGWELTYYAKYGGL